MSWSVTVSGDAEAIRAAFDSQRASMAAHGMIEAEQLDIDRARDLAVACAETFGGVSVSASGHWTGDGTANGMHFARLSVTVDAAAGMPAKV